MASSGTTRSLNKAVEIVFGAVYLVVGALGFIVTGDSAFAGSEGGLLLGVFMVNPLHNIVHLLVGGVLLAAGLASATTAKGANGMVGAVYLLVGLFGLAFVDTAVNILALNTMDHLLHFASALLLLVVGVVGDRARRRTAVA